MKRVSMAFVGQVSEVSSPAIAKLKGRARATRPAMITIARTAPFRAATEAAV